MLTPRERLLYVMTSLIGLGVWLGVSLYSGQIEAWDSDLYYGLGIGVMMLTAGTAGYVEPGMSWRWGISVVILQPLAMMLMSDAGPLMIVGLILFAVFALLCMGAAVLGAAVKEMAKRGREGEDGSLSSHDSTHLSRMSEDES